jgi:nicotinamide riboside kinase
VPALALSGSAGTGKTTLGRLLAAELGCDFVEERMRERLAAGLDLHALGPAGIEQMMERDWDEQAAREEAGRAGAGFVADRSSVDFAAFRLVYGLFDDVGRCGVWLERMRAAAERYDRVLLLPWGAMPLADDGVRSTNPWSQLRFQLVVEGLLERWLPGRVVRVPPTNDLERRLAFVREALAR